MVNLGSRSSNRVNGHLAVLEPSCRSSMSGWLLGFICCAPRTPSVCAYDRISLTTCVNLPGWLPAHLNGKGSVNHQGLRAEGRLWRTRCISSAVAVFTIMMTRSVLLPLLLARCWVPRTSCARRTSSTRSTPWAPPSRRPPTSCGHSSSAGAAMMMQACLQRVLAYERHSAACCSS